jgi:hypothetical protein
MNKEFDVNAARLEAKRHLELYYATNSVSMAGSLLDACNEIDRLKKLLSQMEHRMSRMIFDPRELGWGD